MLTPLWLPLAHRCTLARYLFNLVNAIFQSSVYEVSRRMRTFRPTRAKAGGLSSATRNFQRLYWLDMALKFAKCQAMKRTLAEHSMRINLTTGSTWTKL